MLPILMLVLKISIALLILAIGLRASWADVTSLWRRPGELFRGVLAMYVLVPLAALALVRLLQPGPEVTTALLVLAISAGAPMLPKKLLKLDRESYVLGFAVTCALLAIVTVPVWLEILGRLFGRDVSIRPGAVALVIAKGFLAPLVVGMLLRLGLKGRAQAISDGILKVAGAALGIAALVLIGMSFGTILAVGWGALLTLALLAVIAIAIGHLLGGPDEGERTALAVSCSSRHVGIAMLAASTTTGKATLPLVLAYVLASVVLSIPYLKWRERQAR